VGASAWTPPQRSRSALLGGRRPRCRDARRLLADARHLAVVREQRSLWVHDLTGRGRRLVSTEGNRRLSNNPVVPDTSVVLHPDGLHWLAVDGEDTLDQCAHANVTFAVGETVVVRPDDGPFNITATGLFLLRTLREDHVLSSPFAEDNQLFACCGHSVYVSSGRFPVLVTGCDAGVDAEIERSGDSVVVRTRDGQSTTVDAAEWQRAVLSFSSAVEAFYAASAPKASLDDDEDEAWRAFWDEWRERRSAAI
jgi:hypothetical protein